MKRAILLFSFICLLSCSQNTSDKQANQSTEPAQKTAASTEGLKMHPKYPHIPLAEKGITVVSADGWDEKTLEFHLGYCEQMMAKLGEEYHTYQFCECFVKKIQYYYEPVFFKEAYTDQGKWNQDCLKQATK